MATVLQDLGGRDVGNVFVPIISSRITVVYFEFGPDKPNDLEKCFTDLLEKQLEQVRKKMVIGCLFSRMLKRQRPAWLDEDAYEAIMASCVKVFERYCERAVLQNVFDVEAQYRVVRSNYIRKNHPLLLGNEVPFVTLSKEFQRGSQRFQR